MNEIKDLIKTYKIRKARIKSRLADFKKIYAKNSARWFEELCFCLCTPQSKAVNCNKAVCSLRRTKTLFEGSAEKIAGQLCGLVRFHNNKSRYIVQARKTFYKNTKYGIKERIKSFQDEKKARQWLVENIKGISLKEASHFLRNIGMGDDLAIIDRHILANLKRYGAIKELPKTITPKQYFSLEEKMRRFSRKIKIPMAELDLLFWSNQTGHIFK